ncbi:MAG: hypothetical protein GT600_09255 [Bacteroidales bacterium]|jgi:hypothetical protein|nr:hypothetical protein [Bacteroidales bacterium]OQB61047.1 MAG: hypothetical protein BWX96_01923 [Bacteroidetes bacterium ADurb.Bin145]HQK68483.1 hypothetical protein [Bacteroidales bacterium]
MNSHRDPSLANLSQTQGRFVSMKPFMVFGEWKEILHSSILRKLREIRFDETLYGIWGMEGDSSLVNPSQTQD